ncbi:MAG: SEC-C metal-binding domain-containing protein [Clostridiales bacterium]|nr:SEC-C metal-binding domain-containing protein [Clostridiales bacterium]
MESAILIDIDKHRKQIRRLKEERPRLYELHSSFFREVLICRDPEPLIHKRMNKLSKMGYMPSYFDYNGEEELPGSQITQTVQRIEPKVGRNDPCPCGSGKKYKRCCGV